jgi:hypothetical protein
MIGHPGKMPVLSISMEYGLAGWNDIDKML